jgi:molecular chaperone GrpE
MLGTKDLNDNFDDVEPVTDDLEIEEAELEDIEENSAQNIQKLKAKLKECEKEKHELHENLQRAKAEFLNAKKRVEEEKNRDRERAIRSVIEKLLPVCDSFHMAFSNKTAWEATDATWRKGIESIYNQVQSILTSYNVKEFNPQGEDFNPEQHEAMTSVPVTDKNQHGKIIDVVQNGFIRLYADVPELIRPARVTVGELTE